MEQTLESKLNSFNANKIENIVSNYYIYKKIVFYHKIIY